MIAMAKAVYYPKGERQKTIIKLLNSLEGRYSRWDIWQDFIVLSAVSIANAFGGPYREQREAMYLERSKKYSTSELEVLAQMLAEVVDEMEQNPDQDMLGELFMALGLANEWKGQFFTPYDICRAMAAMNLGEDLKSQIEEKGWVSVSDPACGAGALLLAFANECKRNHINYQTSVFFVAQDIDFLAGCMCYIQMSLNEEVCSKEFFVAENVVAVCTCAVNLIAVITIIALSMRITMPPFVPRKRSNRRM